MITADSPSPNSLAAEAFKNAVAQMEKQNKEAGVELLDGENRGDDGVAISSRPEILLEVRGDGEHDDAGRENDVNARIEAIWKSGAGDCPQEKFEETLRLLMGELDEVVREGIGAFHELDTTSRQLAQAKELAETRSREAQRLHAVDEQSRASLSNLLRAVESSKAESRDSARSAQVEARLRTALNFVRDEKDKAAMDLAGSRRNLSLREEELRLTKSKLTRVMQEKISMERDSRAALSLARSLDNNNSNDMNYYKRKVGELSDKLQAQQDLITKQNNTIAQLRAGQNGQQKKPRKSY